MTAAAPNDFAFVIPVYNHAGQVGTVIERALDTGIPVFVVDDGSTDASGDIAGRFKGVQLVRHAMNRGKGAALLTGFAAAAAAGVRWGISIDADGQHDPSEYGQLAARIPPGQCAIVVGIRKGMRAEHVPWTSRFGRGFSNFWVRSAGGPPIADTQNGFRIYPLAETLALNVGTRRFQYEVEVLIKAQWYGIPVVEAPISVDYAPGGKRVSHFRPFVDFCRNTTMFTRTIFQRIVLPHSWRRQLAIDKAAK